MRLFVALNLPKSEKRKIRKAVAPLRDEDLPVRWVDEENFHVTLKFLGDVRPERSDRIVEALEEVAAKTEPFTVSLRGFGAFPTIRRPRVLWLGVEATPALRCLKQDVEWALTDLGFERETRAFHPHLTLGRADEEDGAGVFRGLDELAAGLKYTGKFAAKTVDVMRSKLSKAGPTYLVHAAARLGEGQ